MAFTGVLSEGALERHMCVHTGFVCKCCDKTHPSREMLVEHMRQHKEARTCKTCSKVFAYIRGLVRHGSVHTGVRPHMCLTCHQTFTRKGTLTRHMKVHAVEMALKAGSCRGKAGSGGGEASSGGGKARSGGGSGNAPREHPFARALLSLKKIGEEQWRLERSGGGSGGGEKGRYDATTEED